MSKLRKFALRLAALVLFAGLVAANAQPQANTIEAARLDEAAAALKQIYVTLQRPNLSQSDLDKLNDEIQPVSEEIQTVLAHLTPRLAALQAQLAQLGPVPGPNAPPESQQVAAERARRQKACDDVEALVKRADLLAVQTDQASTRIIARRRARLARLLLAHGPSLADPTFWMASASELPHDMALAKSKAADWLGGAAAKLKGPRAIAFGAMVALILVLYLPALRLSRRGLSESVKWRPHNRLVKILAAWRTALTIAGLPIAAAAAIGAIAIAFGLAGAGDRPASAVFFGVVRIAVTAGLAYGLLAPTQGTRRLLKLDDGTSAHVLRSALALAIVVSASRIVESFATAVDASSAVEHFLRGFDALLAALVLATALWAGKAAQGAAQNAHRPASYDWYSLLRIVLWVAVVAVLAAVLAGFMNLGRFLVDQIIWVGAVGAIAAMASVLVDQATRVGFAPRTRIGRGLMLSAGLRRDSFEQLSVLSSGVIRVLIFIIAVMMALAPWGVQSSDVSGYLYAAFFGFQVGTITISLSRVAFALVIFVAGYLVTRTIVRWLDVSFLPRTRFDTGLRNAVSTSVGYIGWILALSFALAYLGLDFEKLAIVAGALSVGIGFGLQSVVNNFVSGLILLWERAIRVGDWICVGANEGYVRRINVRSTEIETFDCAAVVIPNSDLVAGVVKNYVRTDRTGRVQINMAVNPAADPEKARDVLLAVAQGHRMVLRRPPPQVNLVEITSSAFNFQLFCFISDIGMTAGVRSDLNFEIYRRFKKENLFAAPPPVLTVNLPEIEQHGIVLKGDGAAKAGESAS